MQIEKIPFSNTKSFSQLFLDYLSQNESLSSFITSFPSVDSIISETKNLSKQKINREALVAAFTEQYEKDGLLNSKKTELINKLKNENCFVVTTGHQLQLAGGPLFFTYKILTTIKLARELSQKSSYEFIPVFWMATEDHDIAEIDNIKVFGKELKWNYEADGTPAAGQVELKGLREFFLELFSLTSSAPFENEFKEMIERSYFCSTNLASATRKFVNYLFNDFDLLIIDGNDKGLKTQFTSTLIKEIQSSFSFNSVQRNSVALEKAGYTAQAHAREVNLFYFGKSGRERIEKQGRMFRTITAEKEWTVDELQGEVEMHPDRFSPNVILRPVYQQTILPNVAYVGGPAEIAYWLQLKGVLDEAGVHFPALIPRASLAFIDKMPKEKVSKSGLTVSDLFQAVPVIEKLYLEKNASLIDLEPEKEKIIKLFDSIAEKAGTVDPTLVPTSQAELKKVLNGLDHFQGRVLKAEKTKHEQALSQIRKLREKLLPDNVPQERVETIIPFFLKSGPSFIRDVYDAIDPLPSEFVIVTTEG